MHYFSQSFNYECVPIFLSNHSSGQLTTLSSPLLLRSHSWAHVIIGMWHKYPNPHCSHVVTVDVIDRSVDPSTGIIRTERVLGCKQRTPTWIVKVRSPPSHSQYYSQRAHASQIAIRWFGGCVRPRDIFCRSIHTNDIYLLCQPLTLSIRDVPRKDSLFTRT